MARPRLKDGFTRIANELLEALISHKMCERKRVIASVIVRLTYGWSREWVTVSQVYIAQVTGIDEANVSRTMRDLKTDGILLTAQRGVFGVEKDWEKWLVPLIGARPAAWPQLPKQQVPSCQNDKNAVADSATCAPPGSLPQLAPTTRLKTDLKKRSKKRSSSINVPPPRDPRATPAPVAGRARSP